MNAVTEKLVAIARKKFAADFGLDPSLFESPVWDIGRFRDRTFNRTSHAMAPAINFCRRISHEPLRAG